MFDFKDWKFWATTVPLLVSVLLAVTLAVMHLVSGSWYGVIGAVVTLVAIFASLIQSPLWILAAAAFGAATLFMPVFENQLDPKIHDVTKLTINSYPELGGFPYWPRPLNPGETNESLQTNLQKAKDAALNACVLAQYKSAMNVIVDFAFGRLPEPLGLILEIVDVKSDPNECLDKAKVLGGFVPDYERQLNNILKPNPS